MEQILKDLQALTGYSEKDSALLAETVAVTGAWADEWVKSFYDTLYAYPPTQAVLGNEQRAEREKTLREWYLSVMSGQAGEAFWRLQWTVGMVHILRRVDNCFMLSMISTAQQWFLGRCLTEWGPEKGQQVFGAFKRTTDVIGGLIAEGYFRNYVLAMERVTGFKIGLISRMMDMEVRKMLEDARKVG